MRDLYMKYMLNRLRLWEMSGCLQLVILSPVIQLFLELNHLVQLSDLPVRFVADKCAVEVDGEDDEDDSKRHHYAGGSDGRRLAGADGAVVLLRVAFERQELHPAQEHNLGEEEEGADDGGKGPGQLYVAVHALVGRLVHGVEVVNVADGLQIREDAGADHEGEQMHGDQNCGAGAEGDEQARGILMIPL